MNEDRLKPELQQPTGYVYHEPTVEQVKSYCAAGPSAIAGAAKKLIAEGTSFFSLSAFAADLLKRDKIVTTRRTLIDLGTDGAVIEPLYQRTGICSGCSHGEAAMVGWCANYAMTGTGLFPSECSFAWAYLSGRDRQYVGPGDTGAIPGLTVQAYHDIGVLPIAVCPELESLPPHGDGSQELLCVQWRDNPAPWLAQFKSRALPYQCRVYSPQNQWDVADCLTTGRPVTFGCSYQANAPKPGTNGVSSLYYLGGHETFATGWFTFQGRLGFIKRESWGPVLPGQGWLNNRVTIQTDDGPKTLYPAEVAIWADEWLGCRPECWAIDSPGSR